MFTTWADQKALTARFPSPPRQARRYRGVPIWGRVALFCLIPHVWVGVGVLIAVLWTPAAVMFGHDAVATVTDRSFHTGKGGPRYTVQYAYDEGGARFTDSEAVDQETYARLNVGASLPVRSFHVGRLGSSRLAGSPMVGHGFSGLLCWML